MFSLAGQVHSAGNAKTWQFFKEKFLEIGQRGNSESQTVLLVKYKNKNYKLK